MSATAWLRTAEGRVRLPVLREFKFIYPVNHLRKDGITMQTGRERRFTVGEHLLNPEDVDDAAVLAHTWIHRDLADGYIENPARTKERLEADAKEAEAAQARRTALLKEAEVALQRANVAAESQGQAGEDVQSELDTPLNQPRARGRRPGRTADPAALSAQLDTPISQLPRG